MPRRYKDVDELAEHLGVPRSWIYDRTRRKGPEKIPHLKLGKYVRFDVESEAFQMWLQGHQFGFSVGTLNQRSPQTIDSKEAKIAGG